MAGFFNLFKKDQKELYPFEFSLIDAVKSKLEAESSGVLQRQLDAINKVQRLADGKAVNLFCMHHGKPAFDENLRFKNSADEALLASGNFVGPDKISTMKVELWLAKGRLFSLEYSKSPEQFFGSKNLRLVQSNVSDLKIWLDPARSHPPEPSIGADEFFLSGWDDDWLSQIHPVRTQKPISPAQQTSILAQIDAQLPLDYLDFVTRTDGVQLSNGKIYGLSGVRKVPGSEVSYYILAEIEGLGAISVREGRPGDGSLYFISYEGEPERLLGSSFKDALLMILGRKP